ncbi:serine-rich adhesin for platelets-like isoform X2 [Odocoileus virginianus]|uniref:Serine-rich adhesin for platelets-like isoform X2 n=1 Tax=Odocoileus virginianus TaxID=9874 RepID=A0A6J0XA81_ODOVR
MAQRSHSGEQSAQPGSLPAAPSSSQGETQNLSSSTFRSRVSNQDSQSCPQTRRVSIQEPLPIVHSRRVSIQDSQPSTPTRRVSIQEPLPILYSRRVSIQEPLPIVHSRRVSIQDSQSSTPTRRVSIQEPLPIVHSRRVSIQDSQSSTPTRRVSIQDSQSSTPTRRVSIQEPLPIVHSRRVSIQDSQSSTPSRRVSIQDPLSINSQRLSIEDTTPVIGSHQASIQDPLSVTYSRQFHTRDAPPVFQSRFFSNQNPLLTTRTPLTNIKSVTYHSQLSVQSPQLSLQSSTSPVRARVDVPLSITHSPEASIKSVESIVWTSQETIRDSSTSSQISQSILENNTQNLPSASFENSAGRCLDKYRLSHSQLPMGWWLLHEAKRISRQLNLLLSLASIVIIGLISLGQPWIHFQVPLALPGDPGFRTISIDTILFIRCPDVACMHEYDQNAYLLDLTWAFFLVASVTNFILCIILINIIFSTNSNVPLLDFSNIIITALTGTSMILGILFYLMQAREYLQEGMTYKLGCSFYLAWTGVFFFVMIGLFSYLNYINFWSLLANQAIWT